MTGFERSGLHFQTYAAAARAPVRWRLLSGNNRDMGRSALEYVDLESCLVGLKEVLRDIDALETRVVSTGDNRWGWQLLLEGTRVAVSGHGFDRRLRCDMSAARFIEIAPYAEVRSGLAITTGRTWRSRVREEKLAQRSPHMSSPRVPNR